MKMSRETRKLTTKFHQMADRAGVQGIISPVHIYVGDIVCMKYFQNAVFNMLRSQINRVKRKCTKHYTIDYWTPYIINATKNMKNVHKDGYDVKLIKDVDDYIIIKFMTINNALLSDYSLDDAYMIYTMCEKYELGDIGKACSIAVSNNVREVRYINAVLEKEMAKNELKSQKVAEISTKAKESDRFIKGDMKVYTVIDVATMQYNWDEQKENSELERRFYEMFGKE